MKINTTTENILYLFWKANIPHSEWFKQLSAWAECSIERAGEILEDGVPLGDHEQAKIVMRHPDITIEALQYERLVEKEDILKQNLQFLFSFLVFFSPNFVNHPDNYILANPLVTPASIVPEWYVKRCHV